MGENSLHLGMKNYLQIPGDKIEFPIDSYFIDIVRDETLYEIQTKNFYALKPKLSNLLVHYPVHVIYPLPMKKWIRRMDGENQLKKRRKSPKHGNIYHIFNQLVYVSDYLNHPNLSLDVYFIEQEDIWIDDGKGSWRRKGWSLSDQVLLKVIDKREFSSPKDYLDLLPQGLSFEFRNSDLAEAAAIPITLARKMTYTLLHAGLLFQIGKFWKIVFIQNKFLITTLFRKIYG